VKKAGSIAIDVVRRVAKGKRPGLDRSFAGRFARRLAKKQRRNWRENGLRPRGRGYDWARQLIPEELAKCADASGSVIISVAALAERVRCAPRTVQRYLRNLGSTDAYGRPCDPGSACIQRNARPAGPRSRLRLTLNLPVFRNRLIALSRPHKRCFAQSSPQLPLFKEKPMEIPQDIQASIDRLQALARAKTAARAPSEERAKVAPSPVRPLFPHTPMIPEITPSEPAGAGSIRSASRAGIVNSRRVPIPRVRPDRSWLRQDWFEIREIERSEPEALSERHRRRLMRHLRFACWNRGLDLAQTRRVVGAIGWEAQRMSKASKRKYLIVDAITWVLRSSPAVLRGATGHFLGMVKVVKELGHGADERTGPRGTR
jgi:hypothetical protein